MKHVLQVAISLLLIVSLPVLALGDAEAGKGKAAVCAACHGSRNCGCRCQLQNLPAINAGSLIYGALVLHTFDSAKTVLNGQIPIV